VTVRRVLAILVLLGVIGACTTTPVVRPMSGSYEECDAPELREAERALARGELDAAVRAYREVVVACPSFVRGHERYQDLAQAAGVDEALAAGMRGFYEDLPDDGSPVWPYVKARLEGEFDERRQQLLAEAVRRDPSFYYAHLASARLWHELGRTQNELEALETAIRAKPDAPDTNLALARVLAGLGRVDEAATHYRNFLEQRPGDRDAAREYVRLLVYEKREEATARPWVERLLDDDPDDVGVLMDLAAVHWRSGDREAAAATYRRVLELDPGAARAALNLGNLYFASPDRPDAEKRADWPSARDAYRLYLRIADPEDLQDLLDVHTAVPDRIARIDEFLGSAPRSDSPVQRGDS
jgi:tetratricopeptide (TPR) repeat protein